jgi:membrane associated rhomboid family serine protease
VVYDLPGVAGGAYWQLVTSMFTHVELAHVAFNMLALWVLGPQLELALGRGRFLALYFISGLAGSAGVMWFAAPYTAALGASGAIFGLMGGLLVVAIKVHGDVRGMLTWIGINFVITFMFIGRISWQAHVGGLVGGMLVAAVFVYAPREHRRTWQIAGASAVAAVIGVATLTRIALLA